MNRKPGLAGVLSVVFPGLGHLYAGAVPRGLALAAGFIALLHEELVLVAIAVAIFGIVDAIRTTEEVVAAHTEGRPAAVSLDRNWALGLMAAGVLATVARMPGLEWALRLWPVLLVVVGFQLFRGRPILPGMGAPKATADTSSAPSPAGPPPPPAAGNAPSPAPSPDVEI